MADRIEVIDALERCRSYGMCDDEGCPYYPSVGCLELLRKDALELLKEQKGLTLALEQSNAANEYLNAEVERLTGLLKEQEAVKPEREHSGGGTTWWNVCGNCKTAINPNDKFCHECGKQVKWE